MKDHLKAGAFRALYNDQTGAASLAARAAGADVTHLDSVRQVVTWARHNMEISSLDGIRWTIDDALKYVIRLER